MKSVQLYNVAPAMPGELNFLEELAHNLWWSWHADAVDLFRRIHPELWRDTGHNPLEFLSRVKQARLETLASDEGYLNHLKQVRKQFEEEVREHKSSAETTGTCVGYFSLEYGIHESVRLYSGGLGALAGDHLKAASDLGLPIVAVGLMYRQGYFQQYLDREGRQQEYYPENEIHCLPLHPAVDKENNPVRVAVPTPDGVLHATVWRLDVGRIPLFLLDANVLENSHDLRMLTSRLYAGDRQTRLRQELLLGIGGFRALIQLGYNPHVCHINEGHAAFLSLERISHLVKTKGLSVDAAMEVASRTGVFTTHTPVPAGNESFEKALLEPHLATLEKELGISSKQVIAWGQSAAEGGKAAEMSMTVLGLRMACSSNGVSRLHGEVARDMWQYLWPGKPVDEVPVGHVTNGVHVPTWISAENAAVLNRYMGEGWRAHSSDPNALSNVGTIPDEELWRTHEIGRSRLVRRCRDLLERQLRKRNSPRNEIAAARSILDHDVLTIGFARRFATYKRGALILHDQARLEALLCNDERPIQFVFAGKAHPADNEGKEFIRRIVEYSERPNIRRRMVFLENYDIGIAREMVQGVDVWLNTPRRPHEASGTSGMKAAVNGALNLSVLDGWWCEGYTTESGWAIGDGEEYKDTGFQDAVEAQALYNLLENEIIPSFYDREMGDIPTRWLAMMKASIRMGLSFFTSHRMLEEYDSNYYTPACEQYEQLMENGAKMAQELVAQRQRLETLWPVVRCSMPVANREISGLHVGDRFTVTSQVTLGELKPDEVDVEVYYGPVTSENAIRTSNYEFMTLDADHGDGVYTFRCEVECRTIGRYGFTARVLPRGAEWRKIIPGFLTWAEEGG
ncbi:MAG: alpha-glucan family phosphorylase [Kiritimatiellae bacterium]|nr:alpha-glucan family phosphorylase [Kiritimatiellia bacterium]